MNKYFDRFINIATTDPDDSRPAGVRRRHRTRHAERPGLVERVAVRVHNVNFQLPTPNFQRLGRLGVGAWELGVKA